MAKHSNLVGCGTFPFQWLNAVGGDDVRVEFMVSEWGNIPASARFQIDHIDVRIARCRVLMAEMIKTALLNAKIGNAKIRLHY